MRLRCRPHAGLFPLVLVLLAACDGRGSGARAGDAASRGVIATRAADSGAPGVRHPIRYSNERLIDVTGDSVRDRVVVTATGPAYDSLDVVLELQSEDGTPLYTDRWSSGQYFRYTPRAGLADSTVQRIVLAQLQRLVADSAFTPGGDTTALHARVDTAAVDYDLREITVRAMHMLPDTAPLPPAIYQEVQRMKLPRARVDSAITAMHGKPRFTYHAGGEVTYTVAWDPKLARFIRTFSCC